MIQITYFIISYRPTYEECNSITVCVCVCREREWLMEKSDSLNCTGWRVLVFRCSSKCCWQICWYSSCWFRKAFFHHMALVLCDKNISAGDDIVPLMMISWCVSVYMFPTYCNGGLYWEPIIQNLSVSLSVPDSNVLVFILTPMLKSYSGQTCVICVRDICTEPLSVLSRSGLMWHRCIKVFFYCLMKVQRWVKKANKYIQTA